MHWLTRAAREVAASSPKVAAELMQHAAELCLPTDPERDELLAEHAISLWWAGRFTEAEEACRAILDRDHDPKVNGQIRTCLINLLLGQGATTEALRQLKEMLTSSRLTDSERASAWALIAHAEASRGELGRADAAAKKAQEISDTVDDPVVGAFVLWRLSMVSQERAQLSQALILADEAVRRADHSPGRVAHRYPLHLNQARILLALGRFSEARTALQAGREVSQQVGVSWLGPSLDTTLAVERFLVGEWDDALAEAETAERLATGVDEGYNIAWRGGAVAMIALHRGDLPRCRRTIDVIADAASERYPRYWRSWLAWAQALLLEAEGAAQSSVAVLAEHWEECVAAGLAVMYPVLGPDLVRLALLTGQQSRAEHVAAVVVELASTEDVEWFRGAAMRCRGLVEKDPDLSLAAADAYTRAGRPLEIALTQEEAGALLTGDPAIAQLNRARAGFEQLGATRDVARVDARLRTLGVRRAPRGARRRPTSGWDSLTPTERTVIDLASAGLSNPQIGERLFVSRRTVQTHLAHVFTKLDITSRTQLAAEVTRRA
jgi:ATP/maltotriose-dependent transcriptional regulator MalT